MSVSSSFWRDENIIINVRQHFCIILGHDVCDGVTEALEHRAQVEPTRPRCQ